MLLLEGLTILGERALQPHRAPLSTKKEKGDLDIVEYLINLSTSLSAKDCLSPLLRGGSNIPKNIIDR